MGSYATVESADSARQWDVGEFLGYFSLCVRRSSMLLLLTMVACVGSGCIALPFLVTYNANQSLPTDDMGGYEINAPLDLDDSTKLLTKLRAPTQKRVSYQ